MTVLVELLVLALLAPDPVPPPTAPAQAAPTVVTAVPRPRPAPPPNPHAVLYRLDQRLRALEADYRGLNPLQLRPRLDELDGLLAQLRGRPLDPAIQNRLLGLDLWLNGEYRKLPAMIPVPATTPP